MGFILAPLILPLLQLVTLASLPATAVYAVVGLLSTPIIVPLLIVKRIIIVILWSPVILFTLPIAIPVGGILAFLCTVKHVLCSFWTVFTPLLWPLCFLCKWWCITWCIVCTLITDTIMPWLAPIRWVIITALAPKLLLS